MMKLTLEYHNLLENPKDLPQEKSLWCYCVDDTGHHHCLLWMNFPEHKIYASFIENGNYCCRKIVLWAPCPDIFIPGAENNIDIREKFYEDD